MYRMVLMHEEVDTRFWNIPNTVALSDVRAAMALLVALII